MTKLTYRNVLKSTSMIGGSSAINILIGMVRTKFVAALLGPAGVGLMGVYGTIIGMAGTLAGMGISTSGVRQIAVAHAKCDEYAITKTVMTLRRTVWLTGILGWLGLAAVAWPLSRMTFGSGAQACNIALLGCTVLFGAIATGQSCMLQGTRRIKELAWVSSLGAINGTFISVPCFYFWGSNGIVPSLILGSLAALVTSWWFARRIPMCLLTLSWYASRDEVRQLLHLGFPIMLSGLFGAASAYLIRVVLLSQVGLEGVGIYGAAFSLSGMLANFVLSAMGADYYPRLTAVANDPTRVQDEINAQTEIALLLATPALAATLIFAPLAIAIFYTNRFAGATEILRWAVFGVFGRVVTWPLGFLILAKGCGGLFLFTEIFSGLFHLALVWICTKTWGLQGTGIAFALLYCVDAALIYGIGTYLNRRLWNKVSLFHVLGLGGSLVLIGANVFLNKHDLIRWLISLLACSALCGYCLLRLISQTGLTRRAIKIKLWGS